MEQQTIKETISFLGMTISKVQFFTGIAIAIVGGAVSTAWYFIRKKLAK